MRDLWNKERFKKQILSKSGGRDFPTASFLTLSIPQERPSRHVSARYLRVARITKREAR